MITKNDFSASKLKRDSANKVDVEEGVGDAVRSRLKIAGGERIEEVL